MWLGTGLGRIALGLGLSMVRVDRGSVVSGGLDLVSARGRELGIIWSKGLIVVSLRIVFFKDL